MLQVQLEIAADPMEVGRARRWARSRLIACGIGLDEPLAETAVLLISELVTNAVVHTGRPAVLCLRLPARDGDAQSVRVEVADASGRAPNPRQAEGGDTGGRGLELVSGLADRWGWQREDGGKRIWCELDRGHGRHSAAAGAPGAGRHGHTDTLRLGAFGRSCAGTAPAPLGHRR